MSLTLVSLFVNQVIKATAPLPVSLFSSIFAGKTFSRGVLAAVGVIVLGSVLANAHSMSQPGKENSLLGVLLCAVSLLANSLKPVLSMITMNQSTTERPKLAPTVVLFYDCAVSFHIMLVYYLLSPEREASALYLTNPSTSLVGIGIIAAGASMAFGFNLAVYYFIAYTSALTSTVGANGVKIFLISASAIAAGVSDLLSWAGIVMVVLAIVAYAYLGYSEQQAKERARLSQLPAVPVPPAQGAGIGQQGSRPITSSEKSPLVASQQA